MMEKICPRCGGCFICSNNSIMDCHCARIPLDATQRHFIAENYKGCLCNDCLRLIQETFYSVKINPRYASKPKPNLSNRENTQE